jgi:hypothetical protein
MDLIERLASPDLGVRDDATTRLIASAHAPPLLAGSHDLPASVHARRVWTYLGIHLARMHAALRATGLAPFRHTGTVRSAIAQLAEAHGYGVGEIVQADAPLSLALEAATLRGALDAIARRAGGRGMQGKHGQLQIVGEPEPPCPVAYAGPMRIRIVELDASRISDFVTIKSRVQLRFQIDWAWPIEPEVVSVSLDHPEARVFEATPGEHWHEILAEIDSPGPVLALTGTVSAALEGPVAEVDLPIPGTVVAHGLSLTTTAEGNGAHLVISAHDPRRWSADSGIGGLSAVILAFADDNREGIAQVHRVRAFGGTNQIQTERWGLRLDGAQAITALRVRIAGLSSPHAFAFQLAPVTIP